MEGSRLAEVMEGVNGQIRVLETALPTGELDLGATVDQALLLANRLMLAFSDASGHALTEFREDDDPLEIFKGFVKGEPSLTAIRDNIRELVFYRNCLVADRRDALPVAPEAMAVRTIRHIYLYLRTRAIKELGFDRA